MKRLVLPTLIVFLVFPIGTEAQVAKCPADYGPLYFRGGPNRPAKSFVVFKSLDEISIQVKRNIEEKLLQRTGNTFRTNVVFEEGMATDFDSKKTLEPGQKDRIDLYRLNFTFRRPELGLTSYHFTVSMNRFGQIYGDLELPELSQEPDKADFIPCVLAVELAKNQELIPNLSESNYYIQMTYDATSQSFAWDISSYRPGERLVSDHVTINAVKGEIIKRYVKRAAF